MFESLSGGDGGLGRTDVAGAERRGSIAQHGAELVEHRPGGTAGASTGSGGNRSVLTMRATPPPINTSSIRVGGAEDSVATRIEETAASVTSSSEPPRITAATIASRTSTPIWGSPSPIVRSSRSASTIPSITPAISWTARWRRSPNAAPREITAAIEANAGRCSTPNRTARYQAMTAATAVCRIGHIWP